MQHNDLSLIHYQSGHPGEDRNTPQIDIRASSRSTLICQRAPLDYGRGSVASISISLEPLRTAVRKVFERSSPTQLGRQRALPPMYLVALPRRSAGQPERTVGHSEHSLEHSKYSAGGSVQSLEQLEVSLELPVQLDSCCWQLLFGKAVFGTCS